MKISDVKFTAASPKDRLSGLLGFVSCVLNGNLHLGGLTLRRTVDNSLALSFPARRDGAGREHFYLRPLNDAARRDIEAQVFCALGLGEVVRE